MQVFGLTGGIGSGKSEAARRMAAHGIPVIDADKVGHEILQNGGPARQAIAEAFGPAVCNGGAIDRARLAAVVFADPAKLEALNAITHPAIRGVIAERCAALAREGYRAVIVDAALLAEHGRREEWLDGLILVACNARLREHRLVRDRGMAPEEARRRMAAQSDPDHKVRLADWVITNEGSLQELHEKVDRVVEAIHERTR